MRQKSFLQWSAPWQFFKPWPGKLTVLFLLLVVILHQLAPFTLLKIAHAAAPGSVVINEVAWAGSLDNSNDEWIELYNTSAQAIDLSNWSIDDDAGSSIYTIQSGTIPALGYFVIEDHEAAILTVTADAIIDLSLANTGDSLKLYDSNAVLIDAVNSSGGAWFGGDNTSKATMERVDPLISGDVTANFASSTGTGQQASGGSSIVGTPRALNSAAVQGGGTPPQSSQQLQLQFSSTQLNIGDVLTVTVQANNLQNLFSYGLDVIYDPMILQFNQVQQGGFLSQNSTISTSFQAGLESGVAGKLLVAEARTDLNKTGVSGSGVLFTILFDVVGSTSTQSDIHFGNASFVSDPTADIVVQFIGGSFMSSVTQLPAVTNLTVAEGLSRYSLIFNWDAVPNATAYQVLRQDVHGQWVLLSQGAATTFVDQDSVSGGGFIIPHHLYDYRVVALQGSTSSVPNDISAQDSRGLKGDNNRSDRVDGRDLEQLARHFGEIDSDTAFAPLVDTTYDGQINGSDLIDLGISFAKTYP